MVFLVILAALFYLGLLLKGDSEEELHLEFSGRQRMLLEKFLSDTFLSSVSLQELTKCRIGLEKTSSALAYGGEVPADDLPQKSGLSVKSY